MNITNHSTWLTLWRLLLSEFDLNIKYKKGKGNKFADAMSQLHTNSETRVGNEDDIPSFNNTRPTRTAVLNLDIDDPELNKTTTSYLRSNLPRTKTQHIHRSPSKNFSSTNYTTVSALRRDVDLKSGWRYRFNSMITDLEFEPYMVHQK